MRWLFRLAESICLLILAGAGFAEQPVFVSSESAHFVFYYVEGTAAERDLGQIIAKREKALSVITTALGVVPGQKISIYLYPTRESTESGQGTGKAFNDCSGASVNYFDFSPSYERTHYGHELAHLISCRLSGGRHELPILAEGLAEILDQSGRDMHEEASSCVRIYGERTWLRVEPDKDFEYSSFHHSRCNYAKAGSFVRFLVDSYGWEKFRRLYAATTKIAIDPREERLTSFEKQFLAIYTVSLKALEDTWNEEVSRHHKEPRRLPEGDLTAIKNLFASQDAAVASHDPQAFASTFDSQAKQLIPHLSDNLAFYASQLTRTEIVRVHSLGLKNGPSVLARTIRHLRNGQKLKISYRLEKLEAGWKIHEDGLNAVLIGTDFQQARRDETVSTHSARNHPRLKAEDEKAIANIFSLQDSAASSHDSKALESTYCPSIRERDSLHAGDIAYYAKGLERTEIKRISRLDTRNNQSAAVETVRYFNDGLKYRIVYRLEKTGPEWKICEEVWTPLN
ncbi:MAG: hypothetical protein HY927_16435 [Elusimicrobia bacterium]|nr:hypothetical protein [Elusimicrobiota bacterium]